MVGRIVIVFLKSPLYAFSTQKSGSLPRDIFQMKGEVVKEKGPGIWIRVIAMGAEGDPIEAFRHDKGLAVGEVFVPYAKIDFMMFQ